jgi:pimeloyl-ACP methyl ester carboxylesterase
VQRQNRPDLQSREDEDKTLRGQGKVSKTDSGARRIIRLVQHIAGAVLEIVPRAGHLSNLDNPAFFNAAISKFLDSRN